jgi:hypothetical protein
MVAGLLLGKGMAVVSQGTVNPLLGAAGISAFPMAGRLVAKMAQEKDFDNYLLMHAMGANMAGKLASVMAGEKRRSTFTGRCSLLGNGRFRYLLGQPVQHHLYRQPDIAHLAMILRLVCSRKDPRRQRPCLAQRLHL